MSDKIIDIWANHGGETASKEQPPKCNGRARKERRALITGGAGFIGTNLAHRLLQEGYAVTVYDNLSRKHVVNNLQWLQEVAPNRLNVHIADIRDAYELRRALLSVDEVYHLAAQVAVTTSLERPIDDFEVNLRGTLTLLETMRTLANPPSLVFTSTKKVYGGLHNLRIREGAERYYPTENAIRQYGISEDFPLDMHTPYGCSKGSADQYVLDYSRVYDLATVVFRMSCIYGPHQFGNEDQGWVAHFLISAMTNQPITIYGDGKQVRDVLFVGDLVAALRTAQENMSHLRGQAFNIGGGPKNAVSLLDILDTIEQVHGIRPDVHFADWRPGDQRYYVSDTRKFQRSTGWTPEVAPLDGVREMYDAMQSMLKPSLPKPSLPKPSMSKQSLSQQPPQFHAPLMNAKDVGLD